MKIIDLYITRKFIGTFFFTLIMLLIITVVIDIAERMGKLIEHDEISLLDIVRYYGRFSLFYGNTFMPLAIFLSVIFFTSKLAANTEVTAMFSGGLNYNRFLIPFLFSATLLTILSLWINHWVLPKSNKGRTEFEYNYLTSERKKLNRFNNKNISRKINPNEYVFLSSYDHKKNIGYNFVYERIEKLKLKTKISSYSIKWNQEDSTYSLSEYRMKEIREGSDILKNGLKMDTSFNFTPSEIVIKEDEASTLNYLELKEFIKKEKERGSERVYLHKLEQYRRTSLPFSTYILTIIAVSLSSRKRRGGIGLNIALGIALVFIYIFLMQISDAFATGGTFLPLTAIWIPNILFGGLAICLYFNAKR